MPEPRRRKHKSKRNWLSGAGICGGLSPGLRKKKNSLETIPELDAALYKVW
jgi:hypothetical protein